MSRSHYLFFIYLVFPFLANAQTNEIPYGHNAATGHYQTMSDGTKIYYEIYGHGKPLVLLHGDLYGDISEYGKLIPVLQKSFKVIAIETRGHGKSWIGKHSFSYQLFADDATSIIHKEAADSAVIIGFSGGAVTGMLVTLQHPELVRKLVYIGGNQSAATEHPAEIKNLQSFSGDTVAKWDPNFVKERKALMPEPDRWNDFVEQMKHVWMTRGKVTDQQLKSIGCPVLIVGGDRDEHNPVSQFTSAYSSIKHADLAIIPGSDHIVLYREPELMERIIVEFVKSE